LGYLDKNKYLSTNLREAVWRISDPAAPIWGRCATVEILPMEDTLTRVNTIFCDVFNDPALVVSRRTSAKDIPDWDSIMHVSLVVTVEKAFGIRFSSSEVGGVQNVGELVDLIDSRGRK
jgi:acyl carrier protein